jgi:hypothetical protein
MHSGVNKTSKFILKKKHNNNNNNMMATTPLAGEKKAPDYLIQISYLQPILKLYN